MSWRKRSEPVNGRRWARARKAAFERDGWRCVRCQHAGRLEAHHVTPLYEEPAQDAYALGGLATLCRSCHIEAHRGDRRRAPTAWDRVVADLIGSKHG